MSKEQYVKSGTAELLRKKGFRGDCIAYYNDDGRMLLSLNAELHPLPCPTQAVACDWLTEEKDIYITAVPDIGNSLRFYPAIYIIKGEIPEEYWFEYINSVVEELNKSYGNPQQAIEVALEYVLTNLI